MTTEERLDGIKTYFTQLLKAVHKRDAKAMKAYIDKRKELDKSLRRIEIQLKRDIEAMLGYPAISASSFSAGTNLMDESDLDFNIPVPHLTPAKLAELGKICEANGYTFVETRSRDNPGIHNVYQGFVEGVEIEIKIRDAKYYMEVHHIMHDYLDNHMSKEHKMIITWIKNNLKRLSKRPGATKMDKKYYKDFKALYYEQALAHAKIYEMLYPLENSAGGTRKRRRS
jgi:hypothetical protein